jgi:hypothetical protein
VAVTKFVKFAAPYRSKTFNDKDNLIFGRNGVINGGEITQSLSSITIAPMTIVQSGLIVDISSALTANMPAMDAPYFVAVSISTSIENLAEVITPTFIKRPEDVNDQVVLVAEYDGTEWRDLPRLQIDERIKEAAELNVRSKFIGVTSGFDVTSAVSTLTVDSGTIIGPDGLELAKTEQTVINKVDLPALVSTQYNRIDSVVFRKPIDAPERIGVVKQITGPSFVAGSQTYVETANNYGASAVTQIISKKSLVDTKIYTAYLEGSDLKMRIFDEALAVTNTFTVTSLVDYHQFTPNFDGSIDIVYIKNTILYYRRLDNTGSILYAEIQLLSSADVLHDCNIACAGSTAGYELHVGACREVGGTEREIGYFRLDSNGVMITPYTVWIDLNANLQRIAFEIDNSDNILFVGFDNVDTGRAYLRTYDSLTATPSAPPVELDAAVELQTEVWNNVTSLLMPNIGASHVKIIRSDDKQVYAFWYQHKGSGDYGVAVYNVNFKSDFGYKAFVLEDTDVIQYSVTMDGMNRAYITSPVVGGGSFIKNVLNLNNLEQVGTTDTVVTEAGITETNVIFSERGDLLHNFGVAAAGRWVKSTASIETTLRNVLITPSDILIAHNRKSDDALYVADTIIGEDKSIKRLYELFNSFGAAGTISWNVAGANKLVTSAITIRFLNRAATYTVPATGPAGVTVASGYAAYVDVPDEDVSGALTMKIVQFGQGFIDRYGKRALPLFWNIGGQLFSNFSPYSFSSGGETVTIGATMSDEMIAWLGSGDTAPDPNDHNYNSTNYIDEDDPINEAIGKLDSALNSTETELYKFFGQLQINPHPTDIFKAVITGVDFTMLDASILSQEMKNLIMDFDGATINFSTGVVLKADDVTALGLNFTPSSIPLGEYLWYGIGIVPGAVNANNSIGAQVFVSAATSSNAVAASAPFPTISGTKKLGGVLVQNLAGTITRTTIRQLGVGSGNGAASGSSGSSLVAAGFKTLVSDEFIDLAGTGDTKVELSGTNATFDAAKEMYALKCDKLQTFTTVGTAYTISAAPSFVVAAGDIIYSGGNWRRIATVLTTTTGTLDVAFPTNLSAAAGMVSQAVHTVDLIAVGDSVEKTRLGDFFPSTSINQINIAYDDSLVAGDNTPDYVDAARIVVSASNSGVQFAGGAPLSDTFASPFTRPAAPAQIVNYPLLSNATKERLFLTFFCNPDNVAVTTLANVIKFECSIYEKQTLLSGGSLWSSVCWTDSSVTPINCSNPVLVSGKSRITFTNAYVPNIGGPGAGELIVSIDGQTVPRFYTGVVGSYYTEVDPFNIDLWTDVSVLAPGLSVHVRRQVGSVDTSSVNTLILNLMNSAILGSPADVALGSATHSSLTAAIAAIPSGGQIYWKPNLTITENVTIDKPVKISGCGINSVLAGVLNFALGSTGSIVKDILITGNVTFTVSAVDNRLEGFQTEASTITNLGTDNYYDLIGV